MDEIRKLQNEIRANYTVLDAGLASLGREFRDHASASDSNLKSLQKEVGSLRDTMGDMQETIGHLQTEMGHLQTEMAHFQETAGALQQSVARLAQQQDSHANRVTTQFDTMQDTTRLLQGNVNAALDLMGSALRSV